MQQWLRSTIMALVVLVTLVPASAASATPAVEEPDEPGIGEVRRIDENTWEITYPEAGPLDEEVGICRVHVHGPLMIRSDLEWGGSASCSSTRPFKPIGVSVYLQDTCPGWQCIVFDDLGKSESGMQWSSVAATVENNECPSTSRRKYRIIVKTYVTINGDKTGLRPVIGDEKIHPCNFGG